LHSAYANGMNECISSALDETDYTMCNGSEELGMLGVSVRNLKALTDDEHSDTDW